MEKFFLLINAFIDQSFDIFTEMISIFLDLKLFSKLMINQWLFSFHF